MAKSESTKIEFGYFHDYESEQFAFYRIPKVLFTDEYFRNLSSDAKVLYGLMLDRMALSIRNNWVDNEGKVYGTSDGIYELRKRQRCENSCRIRY